MWYKAPHGVCSMPRCWVRGFLVNSVITVCLASLSGCGANSTSPTSQQTFQPTQPSVPPPPSRPASGSEFLYKNNSQVSVAASIGVSVLTPATATLAPEGTAGPGFTALNVSGP